MGCGLGTGEKGPMATTRRHEEPLAEIAEITDTIDLRHARNPPLHP